MLLIRKRCSYAILLFEEGDTNSPFYIEIQVVFLVGKLGAGKTFVVKMG